MDTTDLKPFNLERALAGDKVQTRDGRPVKIAGYNKDARYGYCLLGWVRNDVIIWSNKGLRNFGDYATESDYDLFMAPKERKEWVVRYQRSKERCNIFIAGPYADIRLAKEVANCTPNSTIHEITIIE